ncbi:MAG: glutathione S-transferase, partial [Cyanobacteria bacterium P01_H01_bin.130]
DVAVFPYVALARDGKIELDSYANVLAWIERVKQLKGFRPAIGIEMDAA